MGKNRSTVGQFETKYLPLFPGNSCSRQVFLSSHFHVILLALQSEIGRMVDYSDVYRSGLGRHLWDIPLSMFNPSFLQSVIAYAILYQTSICFIKLSILLFYLRLSPYRIFQVVVYILIILTISYTIVLIFQIIFRCHPIAKGWDITITYGSCLSIRFVSNLNGIVNVTTDCIMLSLPIPLIWTLRVPKRQKCLIALILMTSSFVCIISILRLVETFTGFGLQDTSRTFVRPAIYGLLEANVGTVCACLPHLKPLLTRKFPRLVGEAEQTTSADQPLYQVEVSERSQHDTLDTMRGMIARVGIRRSWC